MRILYFLATLILSIIALPLNASDMLSWPMDYQTSTYRMTLFEPQVETWTSSSSLSFRMAALVFDVGTTESLPGALRMTAQTTEEGSENGEVRVGVIHAESAMFPDADDETVRKIVDELNASWEGVVVPLTKAELMAMMDTAPAADAATTTPAEIANKPPRIFTSTEPSILLQFDGDPLLSPLADSGLLYVVNTNWDVIVDSTSTKVFLLNNDQWLVSKEIASPVWEIMRDPLPEVFNKIPVNDDSWADVRKHIPAKIPAADAKVPQVFISYEPAELIVFDGEPKMEPLVDNELFRFTNASTDLFFYGPDKAYYYLISGRWFSSSSLDGPWAYATPTLPAVFAKIPADNTTVSHALVSVPQTTAAKQAVLESSVPTVNVIERKVDPKVKVVYVNETPKWSPVNGVKEVYYATNTQSYVLRVNNVFYCCYSGAWYSAPRPVGPWIVCERVPGVIYTIPASSPIYPVTYVRVSRATPERIIYSYTSGYSGSYVSCGTVVYGTGYTYKPYYESAVKFGLGVLVGALISEIIHDDDDYYCRDWRWFHRPHHPPIPRPHYLPPPYSYGGNAFYDPWRGNWAHHRDDHHMPYGPRGGIVAPPRFMPHPPQPIHKTPGDINGPSPIYNPRTNTIVGARSVRNNRPAPVIVPAKREAPSIRVGSHLTPPLQRDARSGRDVPGTKAGDWQMQVGRDGKIYRSRDGKEGWQVNDGGKWNDTNKPPETAVTRRGADTGRTATGRTATGRTGDTSANTRTGRTDSGKLSPTPSTRREATRTDTGRTVTGRTGDTSANTRTSRTDSGKSSPTPTRTVTPSKRTETNTKTPSTESRTSRDSSSARTSISDLPTKNTSITPIYRERSARTPDAQIRSENSGSATRSSEGRTPARSDSDSRKPAQSESRREVGRR
ncbi:MAG: hypothetical protein PHX74_04530 [Candidatus Sumerlaeales bacterium]|nr:hypothetical protein [Candidatus Sumerlaeales bacterium]